ncbi:MAG: site-2 protease family protein [Anaerolineae bacterium]|nr:site-2 protease family protein [Anaerolineae bacterium]MDK1079882.1 site-2 protease family protein [Anaerolineae bacterium]
MTFLIVLIGWVLSLTLHEFSHALVAYIGGDYTVRDKGYLTFNPLKYTHPVYSLLLPLLFLVMGGIGLPGGAVYIETWRLRSKNWRTAVALVGPLSNLLLAIILASVLRFSSVDNTGIWPGLAFLALLQVTAVVLNLLPIPPLDGYNAIEPHLNESTRMKFEQSRGGLIWIFFLVLWFVPQVGRLFWGSIFSISRIFGIPIDLAILGLNQFRFWG